MPILIRSYVSGSYLYLKSLLIYFRIEVMATICLGSFLVVIFVVMERNTMIEALFPNDFNTQVCLTFSLSEANSCAFQKLDIGRDIYEKYMMKRKHIILRIGNAYVLSQPKKRWRRHLFQFANHVKDLSGFEYVLLNNGHRVIFKPNFDGELKYMAKEFGVHHDGQCFFAKKVGKKVFQVLKEFATKVTKQLSYTSMLKLRGTV